MTGVRVAGLAVGGAGVAGVVVGSVFGILTGGAWSKQQADCKSATDCTAIPRPCRTMPP